MKNILLSLILITLGIMGLMLIADVFASGLRIMLFGTKLVLIPLAVVALLYIMFVLKKK